MNALRRQWPRPRCQTRTLAAPGADRSGLDARVTCSSLSGPLSRRRPTRDVREQGVGRCARRPAPVVSEVDDPLLELGETQVS
jgi:hypothetical protein